jgi:hypothetical protein
MSRPHLTPRKDPVPIVQEAWASGPVWTGAENLAPSEVRSPDCPVRRKSLYRLSYPAHVYVDISEILANIFTYTVVYTFVSSPKQCLSATV